MKQESIDLERVWAAAERLLEQVSMLRGVCEGLGQAGQGIRDASSEEGLFRLLEQSRTGLEEDILLLGQFAGCLEQAVSVYKRTEDKISDRYNLEQIVCPKTQFGTSHITGLEPFLDFLVFETG